MHDGMHRINWKNSRMDRQLTEQTQIESESWRLCARKVPHSRILQLSQSYHRGIDTHSNTLVFIAENKQDYVTKEGKVIVILAMPLGCGI